MRILRGDLDIHPRGPKIDGKKKAIIIGATGATGKKLLRQLLDSSYWDGVTTVARRPVLGGEGHDKLYEVTIDSFKDLSSTKDDWNGHDVFFNCIGTTRKRAGSAKIFIDIEAGISMEAAKIASLARITHASVVSASGANHNQWAKDWIHPLLYIRTIGQKEQSVIINKFDRVSIFRPGILVRLMDNESWVERIIKSKGLGLRVDDLASAMIYDAENKNEISEKDSSVTYLGNENIKTLISC